MAFGEDGVGGVELSSSKGATRDLLGMVKSRFGSYKQMRMPMHDAYASIYRISKLIFKINILNCADFLVSMQYKKSYPIKCERI